MVFMFIIPAVPAILGNFILPMMLGAKDVAFPRLNLMSYYIWVGGAVLFPLGADRRNSCATAFNIHIPGGYGLGHRLDLLHAVTAPPRPEDGMVAGVTRGVHPGFQLDPHRREFHRLDPHASAKRDDLVPHAAVPLGVYATSIIQILATPVLAITLLLLLAERLLHVGIFDPSIGGDPVLFQHFFWFYSHPAVYIMILPAHGRDQRSNFGPQPQAHFRIQLYRPEFGRAGPARLSGLGASPVRQRAVESGRFGLQPADVQRGDSIGRQSLQLARHALQRIDPVYAADAVCAWASSCSSPSAG